MPAEAAASPERLRVLVVDDEPGMRTAVARSLSGYEVRLEQVGAAVTLDVIQAASGEEALLKLESEPPDLLLLDHKLPGISGLDVLSWLTEKAADNITIMMTAYASLETAITATKKGAFDFLAKPFTPVELKSSVRKAVGHLVAMRRARSLEEERRRVRFQFISVLAHEMKAPLAAIEGYLYILQDEAAGADPATRSRAVERSLVRLGGMRKLILDLLDMTRIESGQRRREMVPLDLVEIARSAVETMTPDASARGISLEIRAPESLVLPADRVEMEIVLNNLVSNAVKYNRDGGRVTVGLSPSGPGAVVEVRDTGIGMTPEECGRLFGEFVRIRNEKTRSILGSGLGLSTVRKIAHMYGGDVTVHSEPDEGSTFTVVLSRPIGDDRTDG